MNWFDLVLHSKYHIHLVNSPYTHKTTNIPLQPSPIPRSRFPSANAPQQGVGPRGCSSTGKCRLIRFVGSLCLRVHPNLLPLKKWLNTSTTLENKSNVQVIFLWIPSRKLIAILPNMKGLGIYRYKDLKQYVSKEFIGPTPEQNQVLIADSHKFLVNKSLWGPSFWWGHHHHRHKKYKTYQTIISIMQSTWVSQ